MGKLPVPRLKGFVVAAPLLSRDTGPTFRRVNGRNMIIRETFAYLYKSARYVAALFHCYSIDEGYIGLYIFFNPPIIKILLLMIFKSTEVLLTNFLEKKIACYNEKGIHCKDTLYNLNRSLFDTPPYKDFIHDPLSKKLIPLLKGTNHPLTLPYFTVDSFL